MTANDLLARAEAARPGIAREAEIVAARRFGYEECERDHGYDSAKMDYADALYVWPTCTLPAEPVEAEVEARVTQLAFRRVGGELRAMEVGGNGALHHLNEWVMTPARIRAAAKALDAASAPVTVRVVWRDGKAHAEVVG